MFSHLKKYYSAQQLETENVMQQYTFFLSFCLIRFNFLLEKIHILSRWYWFGHDYNFCARVQWLNWKPGGGKSYGSGRGFVFVTNLFPKIDIESERKKFQEREFYQTAAAFFFSINAHNLIPVEHFLSSRNFGLKNWMGTSLGWVVFQEINQENTESIGR